MKWWDVDQPTYFFFSEIASETLFADIKVVQKKKRILNMPTTEVDHNSVQVHTHQPLEDVIDRTSLKQRGWRFIQEVETNLFSLSAPKKAYD